jgi:hypothetical protein
MSKGKHRTALSRWRPVECDHPNEVYDTTFLQHKKRVLREMKFADRNHCLDR